MSKILASVLLAILSISASAATFTVTNTNDSGPGSLRDAIAQSNANPGADTITFTVTGTIVLTSGRIQISGPLSIVGPGATSLTIDGNANSRIFSIFATDPACPALDGPDYLVSISGLRLTNARLNALITTRFGGGAIFSEHSLALDSVIIENSTASFGGGVAMSAQYSGQSLTINNAQFLNNIAQPPTGVSSNAFGGAVAVYEQCSGTRTTPVPVSIANSLFSGNRALGAASPATGGGNGGALGFDSFADVTITDTRIVDNQVIAPNPPVVGQTYSGGGVFARATTLTITRTEIANNSAFDPASGDIARSGALHMAVTAANRQSPGDRMITRIINSTISGNASSATAGAMLAFGNVAVEIYNSTVSDNLAAPTRTGGIVITTGATVPPSASNAATPTLTVVSSILANNTSDGGDIATNLATIPTFTINATNTLIEKLCPSPSCVITVAGTGNLIGVDPVLGPLAFNGGNTRTQALLAGSPAINAGSNPLSLVTDQRGAGFPRVVNGQADMGAYESNLLPPPPTPPPTPPLSPTANIPTLSEYSLALLALLVAGMGMLVVRRRG